MILDTYCSTCQTVLSAEEVERLQARRRRGGIFGLVLGLMGAGVGTGLGLYFSAIG